MMFNTFHIVTALILIKKIISLNEQQQQQTESSTLVAGETLLRVDDLCVIKDIECYLNCDSLSIGNVPCQDKQFKHKCTNQYCAKDKIKCEKFQKLNTISKLIKSSKTYEKKIKNFDLLKMNLKHCNVETYTWNILKNVHVINENCQIKNSLETFYNNSLYMIKIKECSSGLEKTGIQLCKSHKLGCEKLFNSDFTSHSSFIELNSKYIYYLFIIFILLLFL
jgi:hypothetical protein